MAVAALRRLLDALPWTRGALGEVIGLGLWMVALILLTAGLEHRREAAPQSLELGGFLRPLTEPLPPGQRDIMIGGGLDPEATIALDVARGLHADGYVASRLAWVAIALAMTIAAGLCYRPHTPRAVRRP